MQAKRRWIPIFWGAISIALNTINTKPAWKFVLSLFHGKLYRPVHLLLVGPERGHFEVHKARGSRLVSRHLAVVVRLKRLHAVKSSKIPQLPRPGKIRIRPKSRRQG